MNRPSLYGEHELKVMELMAHGKTREEISTTLRLSPSTVARAARLATDRVTGRTGDSIVYGVALLVAQGRISVRHNGQRQTAYATAVAWLDTKIMSCLNWQEFEELRAAYVAMQTEGGETHGDR